LREPDIKHALLILGARLQMTESEAVRAQMIEALLWENELNNPLDVPDWLLEIIDHWVNNHTTDWVDFERPDYDDTHVVDFIRHLPDILPMTFENNEESWEFTFPPFNLEACISWEGSCYKVSKLGETWD
jgi:hypothetical protein